MKSSLLLLVLAFLPAGFMRAADAADDTIVDCAGPSEIVSGETEIVSTFRDKVVVTGNNLKLTCDFLTVVAIRKGDKTAALGKYGYFKSLIATGHVQIAQGERVATCGRAEVLPGEDKIILSENPVVRDTENSSSVTGPVIELYRGERARVVIPGGTHIVLPELKDLGYDKDKASPSAENPPKTPPAK
jgi:lipopolysaccharide export system protein LptA